jgi:L-amino acid N-acyltransferase YncA
VLIRIAQVDDLAEIVAIYNAAIPGRAATADTEPVTVEQRGNWFREFDPARRPLWVYCGADERIRGWLSLRSFYGRPAYQATVETGVYVSPEMQRQGVGRCLLDHALQHAPGMGIRTLLAFIFSHNAASLHLFADAGFDEWGRLPRVAQLDADERDLSILGKRIG